MESISSNVAEHSKGTWALKRESWVIQRAVKDSKGTRRALQEHLDTQGNRKLEHLRHLSTQRAFKHLKSTWRALEGHFKAFGHSRQTETQAFQALRHSRHLDTWALETLGHSKGTWALRHLGTWCAPDTFFNRLVWD